MSEGDISEDITNDETDPTFVENPVGESESGEVASEHGHDGAITVQSLPVFVSNQRGIITREQLHKAGIKTTHIVIAAQDQSILDGAVTLKSASNVLSPGTPVTSVTKDYHWENVNPPTPATPRGKDRGFKYHWDENVHSDIIPVRCKKTNGLLYKNRFGSGGRGKCIKVEDEFYTPNKFEALSGRSSSKDWKRSIRYGGRTLQCLIEDNILHPHAASCTCSSCCDDNNTGPVKLFVPYKRRKIHESDKKPSLPSNSSLPNSSSQLINKDGSSVVVSVAGDAGALSFSQPITVTNAENGETVHIVTTDTAGNLITGDAVVMTNIPPPQRHLIPSAAFDVNEQKQWWQMEEMANNLLQQAEQLQLCIQQCKSQCLANRESSIRQLSIEAEKEKQEALNAVRVEAQVALSRALMDDRGNKDMVVFQHSIPNPRTDTVSMVTDGVSWTAVAGDSETCINGTQ